MFITESPNRSFFLRESFLSTLRPKQNVQKTPDLCVCLLLQHLLQICSRGGGEVEDMCYERLRAEADVKLDVN